VAPDAGRVFLPEQLAPGQRLDIQQNGATRLTVSEGYDQSESLRQISSLDECAGAGGGSPTLQSGQPARGGDECRRQQLGLRLRPAGPVTNGCGPGATASDVLGQTFNYAFDDIGNRKSAGTGTPARNARKPTA